MLSVASGGKHGNSRTLRLGLFCLYTSPGLQQNEVGRALDWSTRGTLALAIMVQP